MELPASPESEMNVANAFLVVSNPCTHAYVIKTYPSRHRKLTKVGFKVAQASLDVPLRFLHGLKIKHTARSPKTYREMFKKGNMTEVAYNQTRHVGLQPPTRPLTRPLVLITWNAIQIDLLLLECEAPSALCCSGLGWVRKSSGQPGAVGAGSVTSAASHILSRLNLGVVDMWLADSSRKMRMRIRHD